MSLVAAVANLSESVMARHGSGSFGEIVRCVGQEAAVRIVEAVGGTRVFVPRRVKPTSSIASRIDHDIALKLSKEFGGEMLTIPRETGFKRAARNLEIQKAYDAGVSVRDLARQNELTERQIYTILGTVV